MKETKTKSNIRIIVIGLFSIMLIVGIFFNVPIKYYLANRKLNSQRYDEAIKIFSEIEDYKDSSLQITESKYRQAQQFYESTEFLQAKNILLELEGYKNSEELIYDSNYELAKHHMLNLEYKDAISLLENQLLYKDSQNIFKEANYLFAKDYASEHKYKESIDILTKLGTYNNSVDLLKNYKYKLAKKHYDKGDFGDSQNLFKDIENYEDSNEYIENLEQLIKIQGTWVQSSYQRLIFDGWKISWVSSTDTISVRSEILKLENKKILGFDSDTPQHGYQYQPRHSYTFLQDNELLVQDWSYVPTEKGDVFVKTSTDISVPKSSPAPYIGMTIKELQNSSWGKPKDINRTTTAYSVHEQWVVSSFMRKLGNNHLANSRLAGDRFI